MISVVIPTHNRYNHLLKAVESVKNQTYKNIEIIDSPGTRDLDISNIKKIDILSAFWEINEASKNCKFSDCRHIDEKNCAVQLGLKTNKIATSRYNNFLDFINNE